MKKVIAFCQAFILNVRWTKSGYQFLGEVSSTSPMFPTPIDEDWETLLIVANNEGVKVAEYKIRKSITDFEISEKESQKVLFTGKEPESVIKWLKEL